ncbi:hypothetical protein [Sinanaerobacter chloroacetimidivorans]|jgi:uncharacterized FlgJ-related protein|uniref:Uncharacterized protein n=1 Tax=Sinanaerobacter chloroacetimidivorans TaxID=2818044 RepID=A0A8J7W3Y0_9FIRM|nr:hypothetical protein [Sinanaerobacter chloroacetimidivorans]MBR0598698.1 hypothetical protein [Sinanaerobacter chloroacetimidivorans]
MINVDSNVKEYLEKAGSDSLVIEMLPDKTSAGCGCGKTKKFYTPYIRPAKPKEQFGREYEKISQNGLRIFISKMALTAAEEMVMISIEKTLFIKKLTVTGIPIVFD